MIKFHNATDVNGKVIQIDDVSKNNRSEHYYCVGCGKEMIAVLGNIREHHFRHKEAHCSWESYLHQLGKVRLRQRFEMNSDFKIKFHGEYYCDKSQGCLFEKLYSAYNKNCNRKDMITIDLKQFYDTCEEEVTYKGYRADLMLSSKEHPEREPLFLEISVTHDCEPQKIASGILIIEIKITDEKDTLRPLVEDDCLIKQSDVGQPYDINALPPIRFFNFKRKFQTNWPLRRFYISKDKNGILRGNYIQERLKCSNGKESHVKESIYELTIPNRELNIYEFGMMKAISKGIEVKHCGICNNSTRCFCNYYEEREDKNTGEIIRIPRRKRMSLTPNNVIDKEAQASKCNNYSLNRNYVNRVLYNFRYLPCQEWQKRETE